MGGLLNPSISSIISMNWTLSSQVQCLILQRGKPPHFQGQVCGLGCRRGDFDSHSQEDPHLGELHTKFPLERRDLNTESVLEG